MALKAYLYIVFFHSQSNYRVLHCYHNNHRDKRANNTFELPIDKGVSSNEYNTTDTSGSRIYKARVKNNLSIKKLALISNVCRDYISYAELDKKPLSLNALKKVSIILEKNIQYLGHFETMPENTLGERIKKARYYSGHSQKEAAAILGVLNDTLRLWEKDISKPYSENKLRIDEYCSILSKV